MLPPLHSHGSATLEIHDPSVCRCIYRCTAGATIACTEGTYNNLTTQDLATACKLCPKHATSKKATTSVAECICEIGFFDEHAVPGQDGPHCVPCSVGTRCSTLGVTLRTLPIAKGYYRPSVESQDIRRCPDADAGCPEPTDVDCASSTTGCRGSGGAAVTVPFRRLQDGGSEPADEYCLPDLRGTFCALCRNQSSFYVAATKTSDAHCEPCAEVRRSLLRSTAIVAGSLVVFAAAMGGALRFAPSQLQGCRVVWEHLPQMHVVNKLKILWSFYQIVTQVGGAPPTHLQPVPAVSTTRVDKVQLVLILSSHR